MAEPKSMPVVIKAALIGGAFSIAAVLLTTGLSSDGWLRGESNSGGSPATPGKTHEAGAVTIPSLKIGGLAVLPKTSFAVPPGRDYTEFRSLLDEGTHVVLGRDDPTFDLNFTATNPSDTDTVIITSLSFQVEAFEEISEDFAASCQTGSTAPSVNWPVIAYEARLNSQLLTVDQLVEGVPAPGTFLELSPKNLQRFEGKLTLSSFGLHTLLIVLHYDSTTGRFAESASERFAVLAIPSEALPDDCGIQPR